MATQDFIKKIHLLKQIQPTDEWLADLRQKLLIEKRTQDLLRQDFDFRANATQGLFAFLKGFSQPRLVWRPALAFLIMLIMFSFGLGALALASQKSLPGEWLHVIKTATEQTRLSLTKDIETKAKIQTEFTGNRIKELNQINLESSPQEKTELAITQLQQQLISLKDQLPKIEKNIAPDKGLAIAETIVEKSVEAEKALDATKQKVAQEALNEPQMAQKLVEVSEAAKEVLSDAQKTVEVLGLIIESEEEDAGQETPLDGTESGSEDLFKTQTSTIDIQPQEPTQEPEEQKLEIQFLQL